MSLLLTLNKFHTVFPGFFYWRLWANFMHCSRVFIDLTHFTFCSRVFIFHFQQIFPHYFSAFIANFEYVLDNILVFYWIWTNYIFFRTVFTVDLKQILFTSGFNKYDFHEQAQTWAQLVSQKFTRSISSDIAHTYKVDINWMSAHNIWWASANNV